MPVALDELVRDWTDETRALEAVVAGVGGDDWRRPTPSPGWTIGHQISHLAWTDEALALAMTDSEAFARLRVAATAPGSSLVDDAAAAGAAADPASVIRRWRAGQLRAAQLVRERHREDRIPWMGPPMGPAAGATARIMETFAHGQDIRDALGIPAEPSARLRHIVHLAVAALPFSFANRGLAVPAVPVRVEAVYGDETWSWGPAEAGDRVTGNALDLALLVTRRRHRSDCDVEATGDVAGRWLDIAQAYAGPPGDGRDARGSRRSSVAPD